MAENYDVVVLGGGTGGYVAAIRASQLGLKTAIVEKEKLGGTCLHKGCIPSKALLRSAEVYTTSKKATQFGVMINNVMLDFEQVQNRKNEIIQQLHNGIQGLMKKGKIDIYNGHGRILGPSIFSPTPGTISVEMNNGKDNEMLIPKNVIIATGSRPKTLLGLEIDGEQVITSNEALEMKKLPKSIIIVGGGVIGIEWASMLADFDVDVTVLENADRIIPMEDVEISREMNRLLKKKGVNIVTQATVKPDSINKEKDVTISVECRGEKKSFSAEKVLVSVGRVPNTEDIGLNNTEIEIENGYIKTNKFFQTKESHIYAIGDVIGGLQLAHVASYEGTVAVEHAGGMEPTLSDDLLVPKCVYSNPEVASVGYTEEQAKEKGFKVKSGKFQFKAVGKALVYGESDGFVKLVVDEKTEDLLGVHMIGPHVTDMISEAGLARVLDATPWEISQTIHPHPSLSEAIKEAALAVGGISIHS